MKNTLLIGFLLIFAVSCEKDKIETLRIHGTWIESVYKSDTLLFSSDSEMFFLNRGMEMQGEYFLPKPLSGPYSYEIEKDSISIRWGLSSSFGSSKYYFEFDEKNEKIRIGNFFLDSLGTNEKLVFLKVN